MTAAFPKARITRRPQLERETPILAIAAARQVVDEVALDHPLPTRYAARLAQRARVNYANSPRSAKSSPAPAMPVAKAFTSTCATGSPPVYWPIAPTSTRNSQPAFPSVPHCQTL